MGLHIRWMIRLDLPKVLAIERASFEYVWTEKDFLRTLRPRNQIGQVAEADGRVVGFMVFRLDNAGLRILNFAVHPDFRRAGVGRALIEKLRTRLHSHYRKPITLCVREGNLPAQLFFRAQGFRAVRVLRGYYEDSGESAYKFQYDLPAVVLQEES